MERAWLASSPVWGWRRTALAPSRRVGPARRFWSPSSFIGKDVFEADGVDIGRGGDGPTGEAVEVVGADAVSQGAIGRDGEALAVRGLADGPLEQGRFGLVGLRADPLDAEAGVRVGGAEVVGEEAAGAQARTRRWAAVKASRVAQVLVPLWSLVSSPTLSRMWRASLPRISAMRIWMACAGAGGRGPAVAEESARAMVALAGSVIPSMAEAVSSLGKMREPSSLSALAAARAFRSVTTLPCQSRGRSRASAGAGFGVMVVVVALAFAAPLSVAVALAFAVRGFGLATAPPGAPKPPGGHVSAAAGAAEGPCWRQGGFRAG